MDPYTPMWGLGTLGGFGVCNLPISPWQRAGGHLCGTAQGGLKCDGRQAGSEQLLSYNRE